MNSSDRYNLKGVLLDSFQAFRPPATSSEEVAAFVRQVKAFAHQHRLHIWLISHASSSVLQQDLLTNWADITISLKRTNKVCSTSRGRLLRRLSSIDLFSVR